MVAAVVLALVGIAFVIAEVFFVSLGLFAVIAGICTILADILAFQEGPVVGWSFVAAEIVLIPLAVHLAFRALPHLPFGRRMLLAPPPRGPGVAVPSYEHLPGRAGVALTDLRPAGTAAFGEERISVVSLQGMIPRGTALVVVSVEGTEVRVRPTGTSP